MTRNRESVNRVENSKAGAGNIGGEHWARTDDSLHEQEMSKSPLSPEVLKQIDQVEQQLRNEVVDTSDPTG